MEDWETDDWQWFHEYRQVVTEADWLSCPNPGALLDYVNQRDAATRRKFFLAGAACVRRHWHLLERPESRAAVEAAEHFAEGHLARDQLREVSAAAQVYDHWPETDPRFWAALAAARLQPDARQNHGCAELTMYSLSDVPKVFGEGTDESLLEMRSLANLYRCVLGNPFRPTTFDTEWRSESVVVLARRMYASRDFSAMPILADALQDTCCNSDDILNHCRTDVLHVRGCWVIDLVLGKA